MQRQEISRERTNLTIKDHGIWKIKKVTSPILNWLEFSLLFISHSTWTCQSLVKYTQRFTEAGAASYWKHCSNWKLSRRELTRMQRGKILIQLKSRKWVYFPLPVVFSFLRDALFRVSSSWRNFISYESSFWPFSFFMKANYIFFVQFFILGAQWPELILVTLHYTECKSL